MQALLQYSSGFRTLASRSTATGGVSGCPVDVGRTGRGKRTPLQGCASSRPNGVRMLSGGSFWPLSAPRGEIGGSPSGDGFCGPSRCCGGGCVFWYLLLASVRISTPNSFQHLRLDADPRCGAGVRFSVVPLWAGEGGGGGVRDARGGPPGDRDLLRRRVAACVFSGCGWWRFETGGRR